jgi:hypothetical protein
MASIKLFDLQQRDANNLKTLITLQNQLNHIDIVTRYTMVLKTNKYIKNNKLLNFVNKLNEFKIGWDGDVKKALYHFDRDIVIQGLLTLKAAGHTIDDMVIADAISKPIPEFPIVASDIMNHFKIPEGPQVGTYMKAAEQIWIESGFTLKRDEILEKLIN